VTSNQALPLFGKWERENKAFSPFSTPSAAMSFKNGWKVPFLDSFLILALGDDILRIFLQEAKFWVLEEKDNPEQSREVIPKFEQGVRIISEDPTMQCFLGASSLVGH
jgi:hypothetical protein